MKSLENALEWENSLVENAESAGFPLLGRGQRRIVFRHENIALKTPYYRISRLEDLKTEEVLKQGLEHNLNELDLYEFGAPLEDRTMLMETRKADEIPKALEEIAVEGRRLVLEFAKEVGIDLEVSDDLVNKGLIVEQNLGQKIDHNGLKNIWRGIRMTKDAQPHYNAWNTVGHDLNGSENWAFDRDGVAKLLDYGHPEWKNSINIMGHEIRQAIDFATALSTGDFEAIKRSKET